MKLKNKLIPIIGISASIATIAPLSTITSCSKQSSLQTYDLLNDGYKFEEGSMAIGQYGKVQAATLYYKDVKSNAEIFRADYLRYWAVRLGLLELALEDLTYSTEVTQFVIRMSLPVLGTTNISFPGEGTFTYPTVSFDMEMEMGFKCENTVAGTTTETVHTKKFSYVNVPFNAYDREDDRVLFNKHWRIGFGEYVLGGKVTDGKRPIEDQSYVMRFMTDAWSISGSYETVQTIIYDAKEGKKDVNRVSDSVILKKYTDIDNTAKKFFLVTDDYLEAVAQGNDTVEDLIHYSNLIDFTSSYMSESTVAPEVICDSPVIRYVVPSTGVTRVSNLGVQISGFKLSTAPTTESWTIGSDVICYGTDSTENYQLIIKADTKLVFADDLTVTIGKNNDSQGGVYVKKADGSTFSFDNQISDANAISFVFPTVLPIKRTKGTTTSDEYIYTNTNLVKAQLVRDFNIPTTATGKASDTVQLTFTTKYAANWVADLNNMTYGIYVNNSLSAPQFDLTDTTTTYTWSCVFNTMNSDGGFTLNLTIPNQIPAGQYKLSGIINFVFDVGGYSDYYQLYPIDFGNITVTVTE